MGEVARVFQIRELVPIVAADSEKPYFRVSVRLPTGSAVAMNSVTTAYSTERARLLRGGLTDIAAEILCSFAEFVKL
ncbi:MAG: hypothetical protein WDO74_30405 [Pseudomonadota bacterium]